MGIPTKTVSHPDRKTDKILQFALIFLIFRTSGLIFVSRQTIKLSLAKLKQEIMVGKPTKYLWIPRTINK